MLIYNDQKKMINEQNEEFYTMFIPEDNFWRRLNKEVDFSFIYEFVKDDSSTAVELKIDPIKMFKGLLLKAYYRLSDEDLVDKMSSDMIFKFFLDYDPMEVDQIAVESFSSFRHYVIKEDKNNIEALFKKSIREDNLIQKFDQFNFYSYLQVELVEQIEKIKTYIDREDKDLYTRISLEEDKMKAAQLLIEFTESSNLSLNRDLKMRINYLQEILNEMNRVPRKVIENCNLTMQELAIVFLDNLKYKIK